MQIKKFAVRSLIVAIGGAGLMWAGLGTGTAQASTYCDAANGKRVEHVVGQSGCGANAGPNSRAIAEDRSNSGTAVAVADKGGNARAHNLQPGSTALAGANTRGNAYSFTTGPKALSIAQARRGGTTVTVGGWGGQAFAGPAGAKCMGGFAAAYDSNTGKMCVHSGSIDYRN